MRFLLQLIASVLVSPLLLLFVFLAVLAHGLTLGRFELDDLACDIVRGISREIWRGAS